MRIDNVLGSSLSGIRRSRCCRHRLSTAQFCDPPHATHACLSHLHSSHIFPSDVELVTSLLKPLKVVRLDPADPEVVGLLPGEVAIIDQWICAHAR